MEKEEKKQSFWKGAYLKVFTEISAWIVIPVLIAAFLGNWLDAKWGTTPWILGVGLAVSFTVSMIAIVKVAKKYEQKEEHDKEKNQKNGN